MIRLEGQEEAERALAGALSSGRLHHGWILAGPRGIGKAQFAMRAAAAMLSGSRLTDATETHTTRMIAAGSHPDFRLIERQQRDGKGEEGDATDLRRNISVDQIRALGPFLGGRASMGERKVVVIDSVDDLERAGANALLKSLEEPPAGTVFLLISHAPGRLLPTIRSRCRMLRFAPLDDVAMERALSAALPEAEPREIAALVAAGEGAPGRALEFAGLDLAEIEQAIATLIERGDPAGSLGAKLSSKLSLKAATPRYEAFVQRAPSALVAHARKAGADALAPLLASWEEATALSARALGPTNPDKASVVIRMAGLLARAGSPKDRG